MHEILLKYYSHAEAFGADSHRTLVNRLPFNVSDQSHSNCLQARALQRHQSRLRFLLASAAADSPDTERRSGRPHHFYTPLSGRFC